MSLPPDFIEILRCPQTGQRLTLASPELLAKLEAKRRDGTLSLQAAQPQWNPAEPLEALLVREDRRVAYSVQGGIPILLPDHGIDISNEDAI
jgi:uncharacterized protein YbaR (Trm112 family)